MEEIAKDFFIMIGGLAISIVFLKCLIELLHILWKEEEL